MSLVAGPIPQTPIAGRFSPWRDATSRRSCEARALGAAGLAALASLPFLMLSSAVTAAPLAGPAATALLYLGAWRASVSGQAGIARALHALTLAGLLGWAVVPLALATHAPLDGSAMMAALLAPLFAAAPALARILLEPRASRRPATDDRATRSAREHTALLDQLAPSEAVLMLDHAGTILAATRTARRTLAMLPDAFEQPLATVFQDGDGALLSAIQAAAAGSGVARDVEPIMSRGGAGPRSLASFAACGPETVAMRIADAAPSAMEIAAADEDRVSRKRETAAPVSAACDVDECVRFALRLSSATARLRGASVGAGVDRGAVIACDAQVGRRLVLLLAECALHRTQRGSAVELSVATRPGIVLMRAVVAVAAVDAPEGDDIVTLRSLAESAGGTLMLDAKAGGVTLSLRLPRAETITNEGDAHACAA